MRSLDDMLTRWDRHVAANDIGVLAELFRATPVEGLAEIHETLAVRGLPALVQRILDLAPDTAPSPEGADVMEAISLFSDLTLHLHHAGCGALCQEQEQRLAHGLVSCAESCFVALKAQIGEIDYPDLRIIGCGVMKLEVLRWMLEELKLDRESRHVRTFCGILARRTLRRAHEVIASFLSQANPDARLDVIGLLARIDDLILLARRILENEAEEMADSGSGFVVRIGEQVVETFIADMRMLAPILLGELRRRMTSAIASTAFIEAWIKQIGQIYTFCTRMRHPISAALTADLAAFLQAEMTDIAKQLFFMIGALAPEDIERRAMLACKAALVEEGLKMIDTPRAAAALGAKARKDDWS